MVPCCESRSNGPGIVHATLEDRAWYTVCVQVHLHGMCTYTVPGPPAGSPYLYVYRACKGRGTTPPGGGLRGQPHPPTEYRINHTHTHHNQAS
eukprot:7352233-Prymnesium_polylepis.1